MALGIRHRARFEPAVKNFRDAAVHFAVLHEGQIVDEVAVDVGDLLAGPSSRSLMLSMTMQSPASFLQIGIGVPQ